MSLHKMDEVKIFQRFQGTELSTPIAKFICTMYDALQSLKYQRIMRNIIATDVGLEMRDLTWPEIVFCRCFKPIKSIVRLLLLYSPFMTSKMISITWLVVCAVHK